MDFVKGWLYCFLWYSSILAGYAGLFCPMLPLLFISNKLYRICADALFTFWQYYPTVLLEKLCKCEIQVSGDPIDTSESSLIIMNHRTRTDWNFLWPTMYHCITGKNRFKHPTKFVLKDIIRHIPGPGWVMQMACFVFIKRCWIFDRVTFEKAVDYFSNLRYKFTLIVFPEGTDFTSTTKQKSDAYAKKHSLQLYDYVLHPRTTGFVFLAKQLLDKNLLNAIYDVTLVYPDKVPQNEAFLLKGEFPKQVKIHLARYPGTVLPKTDDGLRDFLEQRWLCKEKTLREYNATGQFLHGTILKQDYRNGELIFALIFWSILPWIVLYIFFVFNWFRFVVLAHTLFLLALNCVSDGFQVFEIGVFNFKKYYYYLKRAK